MEKKTEANMGKRTILIIEDNKVNQKILCKLLEDDYNIITADNGLEGLEILRRQYRNLSLIMLDVMMPVCNGYDFLEQIKNDAILSSVPVIVTTGNGSEDEEERSLELGAADFVTKPYRGNIVKRRIRNIIRLRESDSTLSAIEYDELTGLYTKHAFYHHARSLLNRNPTQRFDLMIADIESFKLINERYGEEKADEVLAYFGGWFRQFARNGICARFSGDQFSCIFQYEEGMSKEDFYQEFNKMQEQAPVANLVVKFGIYREIDKTLPISSICNRALVAISTIKHQYGRDYCFYNAELQAKMVRAQKIIDCMETALKEKQFEVYYQPKHDAKTGKIAGAEALVRWIHPEYGFMSPGEFIPIFEENGFISQLDKFVWKRVLLDLNYWKTNGLPYVPISINVSRKDFEEIDDLSMMEEVLEKYNIEPGLLHMEVTESFYTERTDELIQIVKEIQKLGIQIELDDFGSGYSSLGMLKKLPLDIIKLDMSFISELDNQKEIVEMIIGMSHTLKLETVAEGAETGFQVEELRRMECDYIQGYYFSKPLPKKAFEEYLKAYSE